MHKNVVITNLFLLVLAVTLSYCGFSQKINTDSLLRTHRDSLLKAAIHTDSVKIEKQYEQQQRWEMLKASAQFPVINAGEQSGVIPVKDPTELPDPAMDYKLLFELTVKNPDSLLKEVNLGLTEISRIINLHVASGVPLKKIIPVILIHGGALSAVTSSKYFKDHYKIDNPNLKVINDLKNIGTRFIACGQAMAFWNIKKEELLPDVKVSLTAQTVLSTYQLKGYVLYSIAEDKR